jgi:hypothetical protein
MADLAGNAGIEGITDDAADIVSFEDRFGQGNHNEFA